MVEISLTQGLVTKIDDGDFEWLSQYEWFAADHGKNGKQKFYAETYLPKNPKSRSKRRNRISMQRLILGLKFGDKRVGHHLDDDSLNNQRDNLEIVANNYHNMLYSKNWRGSLYGK